MLENNVNIDLSFPHKYYANTLAEQHKSSVTAPPPNTNPPPPPINEQFRLRGRSNCPFPSSVYLDRFLTIH